MKVNTLTKINKFRLGYLLMSLALCGYMLYQLIASILSHLASSITFMDIINLFSILFALLFETGITLFVIRSLRSNQTLMMKSLVFNRDGTPFRPGVTFVALGGVIFTVAAVFFLGCACGWDLLSKMDQDMLLFIADVALVFSVNLDFTLVYFLLFRHEAGAFALI